MKRTAIALGLGIAAVALLVVVAAESRSVAASVHIAQSDVQAELVLAREDFAALVQALDAAWAARRIPGGAANSLANRLAGSPERLRGSLASIPANASQRTRLANTLSSYSSAVDSAAELAGELIGEQTAYGESLAALSDRGPQVIQRMRNLGLERAAADTYELVVGALDYAASGSAGLENDLRRLIATLARDQRLDANMPARIEELSAAVDTLIDTRGEIEGGLGQLAAMPISSTAANLATAARETYERAVGTTERARWTLAAYVFLLLGSVAFVGYRLHDSYSELHVANERLEELNGTLEQRVAQRTEALERALAELKESQVQLVQAEKMSSLGQLVAGVSHEINTPLLYLANNVDLVQERLERLKAFTQRCAAAFSMQPADFPERAEYQKALLAALNELKTTLLREEHEAELEEAQGLLRDCVEGIQDLSEIAKSLKDFSRLDRASIDRFDVNQGLERTLLIARNIVKHKADVHKHFGEIPEIRCSPSQINQVFLNLITNAAQSIEKTGEIILSTQPRGDAHVAITVADTGCGIPAELIEKIRDPFFTTKEVGSGTGLGLSIVDEIVRSHDGELVIESEPGKGSRFTVVLPIEGPAEEPDTSAEESSPAPDDDAALAEAS